MLVLESLWSHHLVIALDDSLQVALLTLWSKRHSKSMWEVQWLVNVDFSVGSVAVAWFVGQFERCICKVSGDRLTTDGIGIWVC